jgi:hypothetical protein
MSETLQENEALMCEKSSMQALNAQLSAEIEGGSRWIDEQRAMHKELSRVRRELSYEVRARTRSPALMLKPTLLRWYAWNAYHLCACVPNRKPGTRRGPRKLWT